MPISRIDIGIKITLWITLFLTLILITAIWLLSTSIIELAKKNVYETVDLEARGRSQEILTELKTLSDLTANTAGITAGLLSVGQNMAEIQKPILSSAMKENPHLLAAWIISESRPLTEASSLRISRDNEKLQPGSVWGISDTLDTFYEGARDRQYPVLENPVFRTLNKRLVPVIVATAPILVEGGKIATLGLEMTADRIQGIVSSINTLDHGYAFLFSNDTRYISHPIHEQIRREYLVADSAAPIHTSGGNMTGAVLVFRDVTAEQILQERLHHSQKMDDIGQLAGGCSRLQQCSYQFNVPGIQGTSCTKRA